MVRVVLFIGATVAVWLLAAASTSLAASPSTPPNGNVITTYHFRVVRT